MNPNNVTGPGPIQIPAEWADDGLLSFEDCCKILRIPQRTVRDWRRRHVGPHPWVKLEGRIYLGVGDLRRFVKSATPSPR